MPISVKIEGARDSQSDYEDDAWLASEQRLQEAVMAFYEAGATVENVAEAVSAGLTDAEAAI